MKNCFTISFLLISVLFCNIKIAAQENPTPPPEFPIGTFLYSENTNVYEKMDSSGMNYMVSGFTDYTQNSPIKLMGIEANQPDDYIPKYAMGYYTRWQAEKDEVALLETGVKHPVENGSYVYGQVENYLGATCWASEMNVGHTVNNLIWGPNYKQEKKYKWYEYQQQGLLILYRTNFRLALRYAGQYPDTTSICKLSVYYRYKWIYQQEEGYASITLSESVLRKSDFLTESFYPFTSDYIYPSNLTETRQGKSPDYLYTEADTVFIDDIPETGIEFRIDWFDVGKLYVDYVEVYDQLIWNDYIQTPQIVANRIRDYANRFEDWNSLEYWFAYEEPNTIDSYTPFHIVDSLIQHHQGINKRKPLATIIYEHWNGQVNGDWHLQKFIELAKPTKLMIDWFPFWVNYDTDEGLWWLRNMFEYADLAQPGFWYIPQGFGEKLDSLSNDYCWVRKPSSAELNSSIMLALAHGSKGIMPWMFSSRLSGVKEVNCGNNYVYFDAIVKENGNPTPLYYYIKDNITPRLKAALGNTLLSLNYTRDYLELRRYVYQGNSPETVTENYLTLSTSAQNPTPITYNFHAGFFEHQYQPYNNYFLLANLLTTENRWTNIGIKNQLGYENMRFRNIEPEYGFDTTFTTDGNPQTNDISIDLEFPAGEGYLFQVAPVVLCGGRLRYPELVGEQQVLTDDMIIENGATLTVYNNYFGDGNIIVKNGSIMNGENGKIQFANGKKLIIQGSATICGTANQKLILDFVSKDYENGITIREGGSLNISYCKIQNASIGITSELNANYYNIHHVDFEDCGTHSISIAGRSPGMNPTPPPQIYGCTMLNSNYGIFVTNLSSILIQNNIITNTACGIYLSNVTSTQVINNYVNSTRQELEGMLLLSSGGNVRGNLIIGYTVGLHLANSAPVLGSNRMTSNKYHGLYIGDGSRPYMRQGQWIGRPPNMYATSGYNKIHENGGYEEEGGPEDNDGSEIYFNNSNAVMSKGCNSIYDDREPEPPLVNTYLLMNCPAGGNQIYVDARGNYWGYRVEPGRFGNLRVDYIPYLETPCPEPQSADGEIVLMTSFGDIIDTVYSIDEEIPEMSEIEEAYAEAEEYFLTGDLTNALQIYESILNSNSTEEDKYFAYERKYSIGKLTGQSTEYFNQLSNTFSTLASNTQDTLDAKILNQLSTLSKVGEQEYETAIGEFDVVIQQNPNTEEAVYAEIDALTTALLIEEADSTLQKGRLGKYLVKTTGDYNQRVDEILRKHFGGKSKETEEELLPTEYTLYQNYPNPFNPVTTIKYDLPNASDVSLFIYDILGRKVKVLVNTGQQAGRYEVQFNASNLASGVYIYQLVADKYINSKKMILLK
jgi:parallel beta-helix repeat protein